MKKEYKIIFLLIFLISGFSALIYESIWTQYLRLFFGHAAYAQTLVLIIFMGGMAIGSYLASLYSKRWKNLFIAYAIVELIVGIFALLFHDTFVLFLEVSYNSIFKSLESSFSINLYKWISSGLLIFPQSILLGTTFPFMSAAVLRAFPQSPGKNISLLYFINSFGASIGVLISDFVFIKEFGLPGTIKIAGIINIIIAITVILLIWKNKQVVQTPIQSAKHKELSNIKSSNIVSILLTVSALTGMASFIYEIGWIRMLNLVLGTSTHAFELMLSAFIFGLAFGGLWIRNRIDKISHPVLYLGYIQIIMGGMALLTLLLYNSTFNFMQWVMETAPKKDIGYLYFNLASNGIAFLIMFPATFFAGMTLPLITKILLGVQGERSIGAVYAWNTVGSIAGIIIAVHLGMPLLGLKGLINVGAGVDIILGFGLLFLFNENKYKLKYKIILSSTSILTLLVILMFIKFDTHKMASGVYRGASLMNNENNIVLFHEDGKTATVSNIFYKDENIISLRTNGKPDASIHLFKNGFGTEDDMTMIQLGMIPMSLKKDATDVAIIGLGAGITTKSILANPKIQNVKTIEIEKEIIEAARNFIPQANEIFNDKRSEIIIDDAKSYFAAGNKKFDIIISEPSNPWVSGVASLFSTEFYSQIKNHLKQDGIFAQWLQLYEIDLPQVISVLKSLSDNFIDFHIYILDDNNCLFIGNKDSVIGELDNEIFSNLKISTELRRVHVNSIQDIQSRYLGNKEILGPLLKSYSINKSSDYYPVLERESTKMRYLKKVAADLYCFSNYLHPVIHLFEDNKPEFKKTQLTYNPFYAMSKQAMEAISLRDYFLSNDFNLNYTNLPENIKWEAIYLKKLLQDTSQQQENQNRVAYLFNNSTRMTPYLSADEMLKIWNSIGLYNNKNVSLNEEKWINLFTAIAKKDYKTIISESKYLLKNSTLPAAPTEYLVSALMIGYIKEDRKQEAQALYNIYHPKLSNDYRAIMLFKFLNAHCLY